MARLRALDITLAGERVALRGDRSLFWPRQQVLVVADLHVGKAESLRRDGTALPDGAWHDDLERLGRALRETKARQLVVLGDLVHDAHGLTPAVREAFRAWRRSHGASMLLVPGNHDRRAGPLPPEWEVETTGDVVVQPPFVLVHEEVGAPGHVLCGHVHPAMRLGRGVDGVRVPCFSVGTTRTILPAWSGLTGGALVRARAGERLVPVVDGWVFDLPVR